MTKNVNVELKFDVKAGKLKPLNETLKETQKRLKIIWRT